jgi:hypothetical protein
LCSRIVAYIVNATIRKKVAMSVRSDAFVKRWVSENVHNVPGLTDLTSEVARLTGKLFVDAAMLGIDVNELDETVGNVSRFLQDAYEQVHHPDQDLN